jgi:predicted RNase H-like nuclease (RuvC/YqgF family)
MPDVQQNFLAELFRHPLTWLFSGGGLSLLVNHVFARRRIAADARKVVAEAETTLSAGALAFANELRKDIDALQRRVDTLELENRKLYRRVTELEVENAGLSAELARLRGKAGA